MAKVSAIFAMKDKMSSQMDNMSKKGKNLTSTFKKIAVAGGVAFATKKIYDFGKASVMVFANYEQQMAKVKSITGANAEEFAILQEEARRLGKTTIFSASQVAKAEEFMGMAGYTTEQIKNSLAPALDLAAASGEDLATVTDIVTDSMTAFGLKAKDTAMFTDVLAAASTASNTNVGIMGETFKYVAPIAGALGFNIKDTALATGLMANAGIKGAQAGTTLRASFTRLAKPSKEAGALMKSLNISLTDQQGNIKSLSKLMPQLRESFSKLTKEQKAQSAATIFGQESMSGMLAIINASEEDYNKLQYAIENSEGAAKAMADTQSNTLTGSFKGVQSAVEGIMIDFGEKLAPDIKNFADWIRNHSGEISTKFEAVFGKVGELASKTGGAIKAIAPELKVIGEFTFEGLTSSLDVVIDLFQGDFEKALEDAQIGLQKLDGMLAKHFQRGAETENPFTDFLVESAQLYLPGIMESTPEGRKVLETRREKRAKTNKYNAQLLRDNPSLENFGNLLFGKKLPMSEFTERFNPTREDALPYHRPDAEISAPSKIDLLREKGVPLFANGVTDFSGGPAIVGETGEPEIVTGPTMGNLKKGSNVIGVNDTKDILKGKSNNSDVTFNFTFNIEDLDVDSFKDKVKAAVESILQEELDGGVAYAN